ncbi:MAG: exodeoxyribonuclease V subunit gamma [Chloroflexi bacterium]|nr:exodeoxyribonuclease V subunit gamma [Chloroflexota bacterium]
MRTQLLLMPVGAGKTAFALDALLDTLHPQPFARAWVLLPNTRQEDSFRQRLVSHPDARRVYFNVEFFSFYTLYQRLLDMAGNPQRQLDPTARFRLLRNILAQLQRENRLRVYGQIAHTPGFVEIVAEFIYELKYNLIYPDAFAASAGTDKDRDLALIYDTYQNQLQQHELVDREGEGWLALEALEDNPYLAANVALLLADGFDQFNPLQARLLALLAAQAGRTIITLPTAPDDTVGRRFHQAIEHLRAAFDEYEVPLRVEPVEPGYTHDRHPALNHLLAASFTPDITPRPSDGCLTLIEAPNPAQEAGAVLRRVKRLLLSGSQPDDIILAVRDWDRYGPHLAQAARGYGVPVALHYGEPLADNPAMIALLNLLELSTFDFRRRSLIDVLRSPYFTIPGLDSTEVDLLERLSRAQRVTGGRAMWLEAIRLAATVTPEDDETEPFTLDPAAAEAITAALTTFFAGVTPPPESSLVDYVAWLERLIGPDTAPDPDDDPVASSGGYTVNLLRGIRSAANGDVVGRDLTAMAELKRILRSLLSAQLLLQALGEDPRLDWRAFLDELKRSINRARIERRHNRAGRVLVTTVENARGLPHLHVFILGLSEGIFPAPTPEDPLYLDSERRALAAKGIPLETRAERAADDGLFYELLGLARVSLTLSRPTVQDGAPWPESHLWRRVKRVFSDADDLVQQSRIGLGGVVPAGDVASPVEAALAVAAGLNQSPPDNGVIGLYNWLAAAHDAHWRHICAGRNIELARMSRAPHDRYTGRLRDPRLLAWAADELGPRRVWSASQFNDYGTCGFRFFAKRLLKLEAMEEPEEGTDRLQWGLINHKILEETYGHLARLSVTIMPENTDLAIEILHDVAAGVLRAAPARYGFRASALWQQEQAALVRKLEAFVRLDFSDDAPISKKFDSPLPRQPYRQEVPFGTNGQETITLTLGGERLRLRGQIDRMDRVGDTVILVDYKTGSTPIPRSEMERGRNFQMMLYLRVAQELLRVDPDPDKPTAVTGGAFYHLGTRKLSGDMRLADEDDAAALEAAQELLARYIRQARRGNFAVHPNKADGSCVHYCDFSRMCRVGMVNRFKREG